MSSCSQWPVISLLLWFHFPHKSPFFSVSPVLNTTARYELKHLVVSFQGSRFNYISVWVYRLSMWAVVCMLMFYLRLTHSSVLFEEQTQVDKLHCITGCDVHFYYIVSNELLLSVLCFCLDLLNLEQYDDWEPLQMSFVPVCKVQKYKSTHSAQTHLNYYVII